MSSLGCPEEFIESKDFQIINLYLSITILPDFTCISCFVNSFKTDHINEPITHTSDLRELLLAVNGSKLGILFR